MEGWVDIEIYTHVHIHAEHAEMERPILEESSAHIFEPSILGLY